MDRSRRNTQSKLDKLAAYKRAREGGTRTHAFEEDDGVIYDEVSEEQYKQIVKGRLAKDDFVEDDGIAGYMDNGMDDWGHESTDEEEEDEKRESRMVPVRAAVLTQMVSAQEIGQIVKGRRRSLKEGQA
jgi:DNA polymerase alpha subunit A